MALFWHSWTEQTGVRVDLGDGVQWLVLQWTEHVRPRITERVGDQEKTGAIHEITLDLAGAGGQVKTIRFQLDIS